MCIELFSDTARSVRLYAGKKGNNLVCILQDVQQLRGLFSSLDILTCVHQGGGLLDFVPFGCILSASTFYHAVITGHKVHSRRKYFMQSSKMHETDNLRLVKIGTIISLVLFLVAPPQY